MSEEQKTPDSPTEKTTPPADATKTPLDNLKNMLSQVEGPAQNEQKEEKPTAVETQDASQPPALEASSKGSQEISSGPTIAKKEILEVLGQIQNISEEMLSPRQVDDLLRPLLASKEPIDIKNFLEQGMETEVMRNLKTILAESKDKEGGTA